jgi:hypothetical protein|nr:MAG TPA: hypothetical protein [Caudoviricetes sp.]
MNPKEWFVTHFVLFLLLLETNEHSKQQKYRHLQRNPHFKTLKDDVYKIVTASKLKTAVTGKICKRKRTFYPTGFQTKEDICISVLANQTKQLQNAFVNVNIYVQDEITEGQKEEKSQRLRELCQLSFSIFESVRGSDFRLSLDEQRVIPCEETEEHIISNKLLYQTIND